MAWPFIVLICLGVLVIHWLWAGVIYKSVNDIVGAWRIALSTGWLLPGIIPVIIFCVLVKRIWQATGLKPERVLIGPDLRDMSLKQWQQKRIARLEAEKRELAEQIHQREQELGILQR